MAEQRHNPDSLAERLDVIVPPGRFNVPEQDADPLIDAALLIASPPQPEPLSAEARMRIRSQVLAAYPSPTRSSFARSPFRSAMRWGFAAGLALVFLFIGLRPAVLASVPGDPLYPVKHAVEQIELRFAPSTQDRAFLHLAHGERRAQEALTLVERGQLASGLMMDALDELMAAAEITRADTTIGTNTILQLEARTVQVNTLVNAVLTLADQSDQIPQETVTDLTQRIQATQTGGGLLLPITVTPMPLPSSTPTAEPSATASPTMTPTTLSPTVTQQLPETTAEADNRPVTIVIEGPVEAVNANIITVFGTDIRVDPASPILSEIQIGDTVRIEGTTVLEGGVIVIVAIHITRVEVEVIVMPRGASPSSDSDDLPSNCKRTPKGRITCKKTKKSQ